MLDLAHQLSRAQRAEFIARLTRDLAAESAEHASSPATSSDAWARLTRFREDLAAQYPHADIGGWLEADWREREAMR